MAVTHVSAYLLAWRGDGEPVAPATFSDLLKLGGLRLEHGKTAWAASRVVLVEVSLDGSIGPVEAGEAFESGLQRGYLEAAAFLRANPPAAFEAVRAAGVSLEILVVPQIDQNQFEAAFPAELLLACGKRSLPLHVITND